MILPESHKTEKESCKRRRKSGAAHQKGGASRPRGKRSPQRGAGHASGTAAVGASRSEMITFVHQVTDYNKALRWLP